MYGVATFILLCLCIGTFAEQQTCGSIDDSCVTVPDGKVGQCTATGCEAVTCSEAVCTADTICRQYNAAQGCSGPFSECRLEFFFPSPSGTDCTWGDQAGKCDGGFCLTLEYDCTDENCNANVPACQQYTNGACGGDPHQFCPFSPVSNGTDCTWGDQAGKCYGGYCLLPDEECTDENCNANVPACQQYTNGACGGDPLQFCPIYPVPNGSDCTRDNQAGKCHDGFCYTPDCTDDNCNANVPACWQYTNGACGGNPYQFCPFVPLARGTECTDGDLPGLCDGGHCFSGVGLCTDDICSNEVPVCWEYKGPCSDPFDYCGNHYSTKEDNTVCETEDGQPGVCTGGWCTASGGGGNDPVFAGFHGGYYYVAGYHNATFALLSEPRHQVNTLLMRGIENREYTVWMTAIGLKYLDEDFSITINLPTVDNFFSGAATYEIVINDQDATEWLFTDRTSVHQSVRVHFPPLEADAWEFTWDDFNLIFVNGSGPGEVRSTSVASITTPGYKVDVVMVIDSRPHKYHGPTPHLELRVSILAPVNKNLVGGWLGESLSWIGQEVPFMRGNLRSKEDEDYEVSGLLAHDFKFSTYGITPQEMKGRLLVGEGVTAELVGRSAGNVLVMQ